jgi:acetate kinase
VLQGTRSGDLDATAVLFAMRELGLSAEEAQDAISNSAGLKGMAGIGTDDCRTIEEAARSGNRRAQMTIDLYVDGVRKYIGAYATALGGVDCMVFGGGIGENGTEIRRRCLENMEFMGVKLDVPRNESCTGSEGMISADDSAVRVYVIPTNEEIVVAYFTKKVVELGRDLKPEEMVFRL